MQGKQIKLLIVAAVIGCFGAAAGFVFGRERGMRLDENGDVWLPTVAFGVAFFLAAIVVLFAIPMAWRLLLRGVNDLSKAARGKLDDPK